jgi:hypothetical protein
MNSVYNPQYYIKINFNIILSYTLRYYNRRLPYMLSNQMLYIFLVSPGVLIVLDLITLDSGW